jgi:hypothetical protein
MLIIAINIPGYVHTKKKRKKKDASHVNTIQNVLLTYIAIIIRNTVFLTRTVK